MKILIVDDSFLALEFTRDALVSAGHEVEVADNIFVAPIVNRFRPDVVLMDVTVSTQRGTIAVEVLKKHTLGKHSRMLLYSGASIEELLRLQKQCGADGVLQKTKDPKELVQNLMSVLSQGVAVAA